MPTTTPSNTIIRINPTTLQRLCDINSFVVPEDAEIIFFGIRGATPLPIPNYVGGFQYSNEQSISIQPINYTNFRCTIGQWLVKENKVGLFLGSTVPGLGNIEGAIEGTVSVNQLMTGFYTDYKKGFHNPRPTTRHQAFVQTESHPVRRTKDDTNFGNLDPIEYGLQHDNIHAAFTERIAGPPSASRGCQIVLGLPRCTKYPNGETSAWKIFKNKAYSFQQEVYPYMLMLGTDYQRYLTDPQAPFTVRLRFGSNGDSVVDIQSALIDKGYKLDVTGVFDVPTMRAVIDFQTKVLKHDNADGIVGKDTAAAMGVVLPEV